MCIIQNIYKYKIHSSYKLQNQTDYMHASEWISERIHNEDDDERERVRERGWSWYGDGVIHPISWCLYSVCICSSLVIIILIIIIIIMTSSVLVCMYVCNYSYIREREILQQSSKLWPPPPIDR